MVALHILTIIFNNLNRPNLYYPIYVNADEPDENDLYKISLVKMEGWVEVFPHRLYCYR